MMLSQPSNFKAERRVLTEADRRNGALPPGKATPIKLSLKTGNTIPISPGCAWPTVTNYSRIGMVYKRVVWKRLYVLSHMLFANGRFDHCTELPSAHSHSRQITTGNNTLSITILSRKQYVCVPKWNIDIP